jgi:hypothetical protein
VHTQRLKCCVDADELVLDAHELSARRDGADVPVLGDDGPSVAGGGTGGTAGDSLRGKDDAVLAILAETKERVMVLVLSPRRQCGSASTATLAGSAP